MIFRVVLFSGKAKLRENPPSDGNTLRKGTNDSIPVFSVFSDLFRRNSALGVGGGVSIQCYQEAGRFAEFGRMKTTVY